MSQVDVLIIGAGPTGLTAAIEAVRHGLSVRIIDQNGTRSIHSKALVAHAKTLEIFKDMGLVDDVLKNGKVFKALNIYQQDRPMARIQFEELDWKDALYPFWLSIPQSETERCLETRLNGLGVTVERNTELLQFEQNETAVTATVQTAGETPKEITASWLIGCDGARSRTRKQLGLNFVGHANDEVFILGDVYLDTSLPEDEGVNILSPDGVMFIVPLPQPKLYRLIFHMPDLSATDHPTINFELLQSLVDTRSNLDIQVREVGWTSSFSVKHFVAAQHRSGRAFLAGDAAHIHSPVGGQGMNSGIQDAYNLVWKLALVHRGEAKPIVLDSYEHERHQVAEGLIKGISTATKIVTLNHPLSQTIRNRVGNLLINTEMMQNRMGRTVAMLDIHYRDSPIVSEPNTKPSPMQAVAQALGQGDADDFHGVPKAGDRTPNVVWGEEADPDLYDLLSGTHHTALLFMGQKNDLSAKVAKSFAKHVQEQYQAEIRPIIVTRQAGLEETPEYRVIHDRSGALHQAYGATDPSVYMIRPDLHIAYRSQGFDLDGLTTYLDRLFT